MGPVLPAPLGSSEVRALAGPKKIAIPTWKEYLKSIKIIHLNIEWKQDLLQWAMHRNIQKENNCTPFPDRFYHYHWDFEEERKKTATHLRSSLPAHMIFKKKYITKIMSRGSPAAAAQAFQWNPIPSSHRLPTQNNHWDIQFYIHNKTLSYNMKKYFWDQWQLSMFWLPWCSKRWSWRRTADVWYGRRLARFF